MLKKLFAGDPIEAARKYNDPYDYEPTGKHLYAANEVPSINVSDGDEAFWRRWLLVEFPNHYPAGDRDPNLRDRLTTDEALSGVLNWAIEGWDRLLEQGHFTNEEREAYAKRQRWQSWGESIDKFIADCVERDPDADNITRKQAYDHYLAWCEANGHDPITPQGSFTRKLKAEDVGSRDSVKVDGKVTTGYVALGFDDDLPRVIEPVEESDPDATSLGSFDEDTDDDTDAREGGDDDGEREAETEPTDDTDDDTPAVDEATGLRDRVRDFLEDTYGPGAPVTVAAVAGGIGANPIPVEKALDELADSDAPLSHDTDGEYMIEVSG
jgi:phage/plasmid-associated DNA primase